MGNLAAEKDVLFSDSSADNGIRPGLSSLEKQFVLSQLLVGSRSTVDYYSREALKDLYTDEKKDVSCRVLIVIVEDYKKLCEERDKSELHEIIKHSMELMLNYCRNAFCAEAVQFEHQDKFAIILSSKKDVWEPKTEHQWKIWFESLIGTVSSGTLLSFSAVLSREGFSFEDLPDMYRIAKNALIHRIFSEPKSLIFAENIAKYDQKYYVYPVKEEEWMTRAIMRGNPEKAKSILVNTILTAGKYSSAVINMVIYRLAITFSNIIDELQKGGFLGFPIEIPNSVLGALNLTEFEKIEEVIDIFSTVIDAIVQSLQSKHGDRHSETLKNLKEYISDNYRKCDCCMENAAKEVNMSAAYVGRLYKRYMLKSISESIQELRIESAKEMLTEQVNLTITQIAYENGFSDASYFCNVFKKNVGVSPNDYRKGKTG